jgi:hypothetical protein
MIYFSQEEDRVGSEIGNPASVRPRVFLLLKWIEPFLPKVAADLRAAVPFPLR